MSEKLAILKQQAKEAEFYVESESPKPHHLADAARTALSVIGDLIAYVETLEKRLAALEAPKRDAGFRFSEAAAAHIAEHYHLEPNDGQE